MKTRIEYRLIIKLSVATMLTLSIAFTQSLLVSRGSAAAALNLKATPSATYQPDDVDGLMQAANVAVSTLNASNIAQVNETSSALDALAAAVAGDLADLAALAAEIKATVEQIKALRDRINGLRYQIESLQEKLAELRAEAEALGQCTAITRAVAEEYERLIRLLQVRIADAEAKNQSTTSLKQELATLQNKRNEELKKLESSCARVLGEIEALEAQVNNTARTRKVLQKLGDRTKASQLVQLIRNNNRTGIAEFLQREAGGGDFVISDATAVAGPMVSFRVDSISHCLSVGSQCSGKSYLFTR